ncbi:hypothetical protein AB1484_33020 [Parafrankia sp. FMc6]|uniref:hypothetical protein n=1 Tax=Parafrankia soli TaxID=2599596 RepID=UPI0034D47D92
MSEFTETRIADIPDPAPVSSRTYDQGTFDLVAKHLANIRLAVTSVAPGLCTVDIEAAIDHHDHTHLTLRGIHDTFGSPLLTGSGRLLESGSTTFRRISRMIDEDLAALHALTPAVKWARPARANPHYPSLWMDHLPFPPPLTDVERRNLRPTPLPPAFGGPPAYPWSAPADAQQPMYGSTADRSPAGCRPEEEG